MKDQRYTRGEKAAFIIAAVWFLAVAVTVSLLLVRHSRNTTGPVIAPASDYSESTTLPGSVESTASPVTLSTGETTAAPPQTSDAPVETASPMAVTPGEPAAAPETTAPPPPKTEIPAEPITEPNIGRPGTSREAEPTPTEETTAAPQKPQPTEPAPSSKPDDPVPYVDASAKHYYYNQLDDIGKTMYARLLPSVRDGTLCHTFKDVDLRDYSRRAWMVALALQADNPEYFWLLGGADTDFDQNAATGDFTVKLMTYNFYNGIKPSMEMRAQLLAKVKEVAAQARAAASTEYDRALFVHDYLVMNAEYDTAGVERFDAGDTSPDLDYMFTSYDILINGIGVCSGYAKAFKLVMDELGIECFLSEGSSNGVGHEWNCIKIDGKYAYIDVTWDDPGFNGEYEDMEQLNEPIYTYFCTDDDHLFRNHRLDYGFSMPRCISPELYYFYREGYVLSDYTFEGANAIADKQKDRRIIAIGCDSYFTYLDTIRHLFRRGEARELAALQGRQSVYYSLDARQYVIYIFS